MVFVLVRWLGIVDRRWRSGGMGDVGGGMVIGLRENIKGEAGENDSGHGENEEEFDVVGDFIFDF